MSEDGWSDSVLDHDHSQIISHNPWIVLPVDYNSAKYHECVHLNDKHAQVRSKLLSKNYHKDLEEWSKHRPEKFESEEIREKVHYACTNVADYISFLWGVTGGYPEPSRFTPDELSKKYGVFRCLVDSRFEIHDFVIRITTDRVYLNSGYGGHYVIIDSVFDKIQWFSMLKRLLSSNDWRDQYIMMQSLFSLPSWNFQDPWSSDRIVFTDTIAVRRLA